MFKQHIKSLPYQPVDYQQSQKTRKVEPEDIEDPFLRVTNRDLQASAIEYLDKNPRYSSVSRRFIYAQRAGPDRINVMNDPHEAQIFEGTEEKRFKELKREMWRPTFKGYIQGNCREGKEMIDRVNPAPSILLHNLDSISDLANKKFKV